MSVTGIGVPFFYPYQGQIDARSPAGMWGALASATGDASGGTASVQVQFAVAAVATPSDIGYSLDTLSITKGTGTLDLARMSFPNFRLPGRAAANVNPQYHLPMVVSAGQQELERMLENLPLFMGVPAGGVDVSLQVLFVANTNTASYTVRASGRYWLAEAVRLGAGPQSGGLVAPLYPPPGGQGFYDRMRAGLKI